MLQKALKDQQIDIQEAHKDVLGTDNEKQVPPKTSWPWPRHLCGWICSSPFAYKLPTANGLRKLDKFNSLSRYEAGNDPVADL